MINQEKQREKQGKTDKGVFGEGVGDLLGVGLDELGGDVAVVRGVRAVS